MKYKIDEEQFSWAMFACRVAAAAAIMYGYIGIFLNLRKYATNLIALGFGSFSVNLAGLICGAGIILCLALLLGYRTRLTSICLIVLSLAAAFVFAGNIINNIYITFSFLAIAALMPSVIMGPGLISVDKTMAAKKEKDFLRK
ncbi:hypothetical protein Dip518_001128 [Parelusimicrobium proximum]|uniref:hypothetical protein n=1 Tax=Parelusimicrobium proximum TaxID=3228953 RepID=UPI003D16630D